MISLAQYHLNIFENEKNKIIYQNDEIIIIKNEQLFILLNPLNKNVNMIFDGSNKEKMYIKTYYKENEVAKWNFSIGILALNDKYWLDEELIEELLNPFIKIMKNNYYLNLSVEDANKITKYLESCDCYEVSITFQINQNRNTISYTILDKINTLFYKFIRIEGILYYENFSSSPITFKSGLRKDFNINSISLLTPFNGNKEIINIEGEDFELHLEYNEEVERYIGYVNNKNIMTNNTKYLELKASNHLELKQKIIESVLINYPTYKLIERLKASGIKLSSDTQVDYHAYQLLEMIEI